MANTESKQEDSPVKQDPGQFEFEASTNDRSSGDHIHFQNPTMKSKLLSKEDNRRSEGENSRNSYLANTVHYKQSKQLILRFPSGKSQPLSFNPEDQLTVGWLYSEFWRNMNSMGETTPTKSLADILLCTEQKDMNLDYLLSDYSESLAGLPDGTKIWIYQGYELKGSVSLKDILIIKNIGIGGFSKVFLVRRNDNGRFYALKFIPKKDLKQSGKEEYAFNEKKLLRKLRHKFINRFVFSFQTGAFLCFGLEFAEGGSLYDLLRFHGSFNEDVVRVVMAQVALALQYLHKKGVLYRDIKVSSCLT